MLDSLVRVSRRVDENHFANTNPNHGIRRRQKARPSPTIRISTDTVMPANQLALATLRFDHARERRTDLEPTPQCYFPSLPP